jgi:hypothetical protein
MPVGERSKDAFMAQTVQVKLHVQIRSCRVKCLLAAWAAYLGSPPPKRERALNLV